MKKTLLLLLFFLSFVVSAQDIATINKLTKSYSMDELRALSDRMANSGKTKFTFSRIENETKPNGEKLVVFQYTADGKNDDLTIMYGTNDDASYYFDIAFGKYSDLAGFYISTFYPTSTPDLVLNSYNLQQYRVSKDLRYKISELEPDSWTIEKTY